MKKKAMIMAVASLGSMALIGTGFAGWVISARTTTQAAGVMVAYDVKDQRFNKINAGKWTNGKEGTPTGEKANIVFGKSKTEVSNQWLHYDTAAMETESLSDTYVFEVSSKDTSDSGSFTVALSSGTPEGFVVTDTNDAWKNATTGAKAAVNPTPAIVFLKDDGATDGKYTFAEGKATVKMKITFSWGSAFGERNPFDYYNGKEATEENVMEAVNSLNLVKALNKVAFTVNLVIDRVAA
ncbi:MAG: hypothetical protein PUE65_00825 [Mollicutes bacterium]|nr:hypothetical protein [Mollicutes bacterium]